MTGEGCAYNTAKQESEKAMQHKKDALGWINKPPPEPGERLSWTAKCLGEYGMSEFRAEMNDYEAGRSEIEAEASVCLLYTSDAADDM
eukprot:7459469-Alexandrium_andersonii.AAC.1